MANGDCPVGARNETNIGNLERRMEKLEVVVTKACESIHTHIEESRVEKAGTTRRDMLADTLLKYLTPILILVLGWWLKAGS
jgi:hypothetical protein